MPARAEPFWRATASGVILAIRLTSRSSADAVEGIDFKGEKPFLKARVTAVPEKGKANAALEKMVAGWLGVAPSSVSVERGGKSRLKSVLVSGDAGELERMIRMKMTDGENG